MEEQANDRLAKEARRDSGYRKAAQFLIILGKEEAAKVLKHLSPEEVEGLSMEIARINSVEERESKKILEEFGYLFKSRDLVAQGGLKKAQEMLVAAFGEEKGTSLFNRIKIRTAYEPFTFLQDLDFHQVILLLKDESVPVLSVILSCLNPRLSAGILNYLPSKTQKELARRIARMNKVSPEVIYQAEESLREKIRTQGHMITQEIDGKTALAEIMKHLDFSTEHLLIGELEENDPELAESIRQKLFDVDVIPRIPDRELEIVLREFSDQEIAVILKGKENDIKKKIKSNVSSRRRDMIQLEYDALGEVMRSEADKATTEFMNYLRERAERGEIHLMEKGDEYVE